MMTRLLLIAPDFNPDFRPARNSRFANAHKGSVMPLGIATVAALTPEDIEVVIWDEAIKEEIGPDTDLMGPYDLVGVTGYEPHIGRMLTLARFFRARGIPVAVGGPAVSAAPELYRDDFDVLFIGEAEYIWPQFIRDWRSGEYRNEYRQVGKVDMADSPAPKWGVAGADVARYRTAAVQTTRGCPFDCEFCNVTLLYGRKARHKSVEQVLREVKNLADLGARKLHFCDDNFIGEPEYARELLAALLAWNAGRETQMSFYTSLTLNVAKDDEILGLLADAGFVGVFIGIESSNIDSLIEMNKPQNYKTDIFADVKKIHSFGLPIEAGMIVGLDHDDLSVFDRHLRFLQALPIVRPHLNMLSAPVGTVLWRRLQAEGRTLERHELDGPYYAAGLCSIQTNIIPKQMTRVQLLEGYRWLVEQVRSWANFEERFVQFVDQAAVGRRRTVSGNEQVLVTPPAGDDHERVIVDRLFDYLLKNTPELYKVGGSLIRRQQQEVSRLHELLSAIDAEVARERAQGHLWKKEVRALVAERPWRTAFRNAFPPFLRVLRERSTNECDPVTLIKFTQHLLHTTQKAETGMHISFDLVSQFDAWVMRQTAAAPLISVTDFSPSRSTLPGVRSSDVMLRDFADDVLKAAEQEERRVRMPAVGLT